MRTRHHVYLSLLLFISFFFLTPSLSRYAYAALIQLPATSQIKCYNSDGLTINCTGTGQDGDTRTGAAWPTNRFLNNNNGTITDNLTSLIWLQNADLAEGQFSWQDALDIIKAMNQMKYLGFSDWRLPNWIELDSLVNRNVAYPASYLTDQGFINVKIDLYFYWSSTTIRYFDYAMKVRMYDGHFVSEYKHNTCYVWPVRGGQEGNGIISLQSTGQTDCYNDYGTIACNGTGQDGDTKSGITQPQPRLNDNSNQTISDNLTGLTWAKNANLASKTHTWQQALDYIKSLNAQNYAGFNDWRLPNINELSSLATSDKSTINNIQADGYWSSTSSEYDKYNALWFTFNHEYTTYVGSAYKYHDYYTWPVRGESTTVKGVVSNTYRLSTSQGGTPNASLLDSVHGDNDYLSSAENTETSTNPNIITHALYPVEFYTQKTSDNSCAISANGIPEPANDTRQPLILIHGWQGSNDMNYPSVLCKDENLGETYWNNFIQYFKASPTLREKYRLYVYHYPSYKHVTFNARVLSRMLQGNAYIKSWIANSGKITILAHSMGGLVSRSLLEEHLSGEDTAHFYQYPQPDGSTASKTGLDILDKLVTVATPHHGSPAAVYWWAYNSPNWTGNLAWVAKDLYTPGSQDLFWDNYDGVLAWVFKDGSSLNVTYAEGYESLNTTVNLDNSGRLKANTNFDSYYRSKLESSYIKPSEYSGLFYLGPELKFPATFNRYPNPWLSSLNYRFKQNLLQYQNKYVFISGYNDGNSSSADNRLNDDQLREFADDVVYAMGYINDWAVPLTSGSLDFSKEATGLGPFDLNPKLFPLNEAEGKATLFTDFLSDHLKVIHVDTVNGIPVRVLKDYHHDRLLNGGYLSASTDLLDGAADSGFKDGGGRTLYLDQTGFKHPAYVSRTFPSKLIYEPVFQVVRSFLAPVFYRDLVQNGGFESGASVWSQTNTDGNNLIVNNQISGSNGGNNSSLWYAHFGSATSIQDILSQTIAIPNTALSAKLSYAYRVYTEETNQGTVYDTLTVKLFSSTGVPLQTLATYSNLDAQNPVWQGSKEYDLSAYKGQSVTVAFIYSSPTKLYKITHFYIDDVRLITTEQSGLPKTLSVSLNGTGSGNVTAIPYSLSCVLGSCGLILDYGTDITLAATASTGSAFTGWSGACLGTGNCNLTLDADKSVTATFSMQNNVKNGLSYYGTLQNACDAVATGNTIQAKAMEFLGNLLIDKGVNFTLRGGYDADFGSPSGYTSLDGVLTISRGSATIDKIIVK